MAINNIKITTHDIFIEKDNKDKGGNLTIGTTTNATSNLIVHGNISGDKATVGSGGLTVDGATGMTTLDVSGSTVTNSLTVNTNTTNKGDLTVSGTTNTSTLKVSGSTTTQSLTVSGATNTNTLSVTESVTTKTLNVTGSTTTNSLTVTANIGANGATIGTSGLTVNGTTNTNALIVTGNTTNNGNFTVSENTKTNTLTVTGNTDNKGNLIVGTTGASSNLTVHGSTTTDSLTVNTTINVTGNSKTVTLSAGTRTDTSGNTFKCLNIGGEVNIDGQITVNGPIISAGDNIKIDAIETGNVTVGTSDSPSYDLTVYGSANIIGTSGNSIVGSNGNLTVSKNISTNTLNATGTISLNSNTVLRQNDSKTEVIVGSNDKSLKLFGSGDRPSYSKNGEGNINIALASDIYNPTITIKQAGAEKGSFTLNQSDGKTIELTDTTYTAGTALGLSTDNEFYVKTNYATDGTNYQVTTDDSGNLYVAVPWTNVATTSSNGLMSSTDKSKLDGIAENANNYSLPVATSEALGGIKVGYSSNGTKYAVELDSDKAYVNVPWTNVATTSSNGLMSSTDKSKLDGIADKANNYSLPVATSEALGGIKVGYSSSGNKYAVELDSDKAYVNVPWTNTWKENSSTSEGFVASGANQKNKVWKTDASGNPGWRDDTDTWRGIQNNLTSDSTDDSLSAAQGKELKRQIDGKVDISTNQTISGTKTFNNAVKGLGGFVIEGTRNSVTLTTTYDNDQISYSRAMNGQLTDAYTYSLPKKSGTFAVTDELKSYLSKSGGTMTGTLDLGPQYAGIQFNTEDFVVTNMESGSVQITVEANATLKLTSKEVTFHDGAKGDGSWHVTVTADGQYSSYLTIGVANVRNNGFDIFARTMGAVPTGFETMYVHYVAVKYF